MPNEEFLPPANEVWGKVILSQECVKNSIHGGGLVPGPGGSATGSCLVRGSLVLGGLLPGGVPGLRGVWSRGVSGLGGVPGGDPPTATAAGGTHPTRMHSCIQYLCTLI